MKTFLPALVALIISILPACKKDEKVADKKENISVNFDYLEIAGYEFATRYLNLPDNDIIKQDFLLDVRSRIDQLFYQTSPTHAIIFEKAFSDSAGVSVKI